MANRRPRLIKPWGWKESEVRYTHYDPREIIEGYLLNDPTKYCWDTRDRGRGPVPRTPIRLSNVLPYWNKNCYPNTEVDSIRGHGYWYPKTPQNLTDEDKSFLRWVIRQGRVPDAPTKDPGIYEKPKKEKSKKG
jgi:hypothetical protein